MRQFHINLCSQHFFLYFVCMTLSGFNVLTEREQAAILWDEGVYIASRDDESVRYILYHLDAFYVEVWYDQYDNKILKFRTFSSTDALEPYLQQVDIEF